MAKKPDPVKDAVYDLFREKMKRESEASIIAHIKNGEELLPRKAALNKGTIKHGDMLVTLLKAAKDELASRKTPSKTKPRGKAERGVSA